MNAPRIGIVGAGAGGIAAAYKLRLAGFEDVVILEQAEGVGGTWWHNRYPGLACDVKSHLYSFSFAPKPDWSKPYGERDEIQAYLAHVVDSVGLGDHIRLGTKVIQATWDDDRCEWTLQTAAGESLTFDVVVAGVGMFNEPSWPEIDGLDAFGGQVVHSARWDPELALEGKRVGVIGSAASAVQLIPEVAKAAGHLTVFQRSPNWVLPKEDVPWAPEEIEGFRADPDYVALQRQAIFDQVDSAITFANPDMLVLATQAGLRAIDAVEDPEVRSKLTPHTPYGCQRPLISNDYFPTFNRDNVELVVEPIRCVTHDGIVTDDGDERALDVLVLATGFKTTAFLSTIDVKGRDGADLGSSWADGAHAYLGITTSGFPNLFMLYGPNTNNGSIIYMLECQADYVVQALRWMREDGLDWIDVQPEVEAQYNEQLQRDLDTIGVWSTGGCHNYYRGVSGHIVTQWPHTMTEYRRRTQRVDPGDFVVGRA